MAYVVSLPCSVKTGGTEAGRREEKRQEDRGWGDRGHLLFPGKHLSGSSQAAAQSPPPVNEWASRPEPKCSSQALIHESAFTHNRPCPRPTTRQQIPVSPCSPPSSSPTTAQTPDPPPLWSELPSLPSCPDSADFLRALRHRVRHLICCLRRLPSVPHTEAKMTSHQTKSMKHCVSWTSYRSVR